MLCMQICKFKSKRGVLSNSGEAKESKQMQRNWNTSNSALKQLAKFPGFLGIIEFLMNLKKNYKISQCMNQKPRIYLVVKNTKVAILPVNERAKFYTIFVQKYMYVRKII
jgi:hypothetical protein